MGYHRAGFDVTGVDIEPHPDYPFPFILADALTVDLDGYDAIHASPPCPAHSAITPGRDDHPDLVGPTRERLTAWGGPWVIENVPNAPLIGPALYCGAAFGLGTVCRDGKYRPLRRHRIFESSVFLMTPGCACSGREALGVYGTGGGGRSTRPSGGGGYKGHREEYGPALGIDWMTRRADLADAIPPAYTEHIGAQLLDHLKERAA